MCAICGCSGAGAEDGHAHPPEHQSSQSLTHPHGAGRGYRHGHRHADGTWHEHEHEHEHERSDEHAREPSAQRLVRIEQALLAGNDARARDNRAWFARHGVFVLNLMSSPGSGKTSLLVKTIDSIAGRVPVAVIEGDQQTSLDAERIRATGVPAVQINTGRGCHLDAAMVARALDHLSLQPGSLLLIENVGNLVCPAAFDLGEAHKVVVLSVTEGEDKPLKYPDMFAASDLMLLNKCDLLPHIEFDLALAVDSARRIQPELRVLQVSARTGAGLDAWVDWLIGCARLAGAAAGSAPGAGD